MVYSITKRQRINLRMLFIQRTPEFCPRDQVNYRLSSNRVEYLTDRIYYNFYNKRFDSTERRRKTGILSGHRPKLELLKVADTFDLSRTIQAGRAPFTFTKRKRVISDGAPIRIGGPQ